jgi:arsenate reductase
MPAADRAYNVLFLCTGNSARSILGEALLNSGAYPGFRGFSAGSQPKGEVNPMTLEVLRGAGIATAGLRSKAWDEFAMADAPKMDFIFTVCDNAAGEACPVWPGKPATAHWGLEDPAAVEGPDFVRRAAFETTLQFLRNRLDAFTSLPLSSIDAMTLDARLSGIGRMDGASTKSKGAA